MKIVKQAEFEPLFGGNPASLLAGEIRPRGYFIYGANMVVQEIRLEDVDELHTGVIMGGLRKGFAFIFPSRRLWVTYREGKRWLVDDYWKEKMQTERVETMDEELRRL